MTQYTLADFNAIPAGGEALPPEGSDYTRAIHLPADSVDHYPWALVRGEGLGAVVDRVAATYLVVSGFTPADRLGMTLAGPKPGGEDDEQLTVRVVVEYPLNEGVAAWAVAKSMPDIVSDEDAFHRLIQMGDQSAAKILGRLALGGE